MVPPLTRDADVHPPLFTRAFVLAWFANAMLNLAGFLFVHLPGFLQQRGAGEAQIGRIMAAQAVGANRELFLGALGFAVLGLILCLPLRDVPPVHSEANLPPRSILATAAQRNLLPVWLAAFTFFVGVVALFNFMKTFVTTMGTGSVGAFFSGYTAIAVALRIFLGRLPDRLGARRMLGFAMSSYAAGLGALSLAQKPWHVVAAGLLCGAGHGYTFPVLLSLVVARARAQERGAATSFFMALDWMGLLLAGPLIGYVIEHTGYGTAFMGVALVLAIGIGLFYGLDRALRTASSGT